MKNKIIVLSMLISAYTIAQKAQPVYGIVKDRQEISWYAEQEVLWKKEVDKNKKNADAWCNYYEAVRAQYLLNGRDTKEGMAFFERQNKIVEDLYSALPNSFEANYLKYRNNNKLGETENIKYLQRAFEIDPTDSRTYSLFIVLYEIQRNKKGFHDFCERYFKANELPSSTYNWAYNILSETEQNAILFTGGDLDSYSIWALQEVKNFRKDVRIINTSMLLLDDYRSAIFAEMGLAPFTKTLADCKSQEELSTLTSEMYAHVLKNEKNIPVYVAGTTVYQFQNDFEDDLYLVGLSYKYSVESIDNISLIRRNYEKRYLLDNLTMNFSFNVSDKIGDHLNATYLPSFVKLYFHYRDTEEIEKMQTIKSYLLDIAKKADQYDDIIKLIEA